MVGNDEDFRLIAARKFSEGNPEHRCTLFSYYAVDTRHADNFERNYRAVIADQKGWHPTALFLVTVTEARETLTRTDFFLYAGLPDVEIYLDRRQITLPRGQYLILGSPAKLLPEGMPDVFTSRAAISAFLGMIVAYMGRGLILGHVGEEIIIPENMRKADLGQLVRFPVAADYVSFESPNLLQEVIAATNKLPNEERDAIMYAWSLMGRAVTEADEVFGFITSWVALEVVAKGKGVAITGQLARAYGADIKSARRVLELEKANRLRDLILHKGRRPAIGSRTFRLMQCYFIDLLRFRLGLSCMRATSSAIAATEPQAKS